MIEDAEFWPETDRMDKMQNAAFDAISGSLWPKIIVLLPALTDYVEGELWEWTHSGQSISNPS